MEDKKLNDVRWIRKMFIVALAVMLGVSFIAPKAVSAASAKKITIDEDEYDLYTDNFPDPIADDVYAKFSGSVKDHEEYYLMFDQDLAEESFKTALDKNKVNYDEDYICYMKCQLFKYAGENDDDDKLITSQKLEIYFPLPDDAQEHPEDCAFYKLASGKLTQVYPLQLYEIDEINYIKMTMTSSADFSAFYGFVYTDPYSYEDEDEDDDDEDDITKAPTKKPTATPTPKPSADKNSGGTSSTGSVKPASSSKDSIPKTGDDFPLGGMIIGSCLAFSVLVITFVKAKNK